MFDLHAHVLPGIDDGPRTLDDAVTLMRAMAHDGIEHVVATPHIYPGVFDNTPAQIEAAFEQLRRALLSEDIAITMTWAAEVRICPEILEWLELRRLPLLNGSLVGPASVLIELPDGQIPVGTDRLMGLLIDQGITPLIAHPERNKVVMEQPTRLDILRQLGCQFQVTAGSVLGEFGRRAQTTAQRLLDAGHVDVIASDAHNLSGRRPRMQAAREWLTEHYDAALAERLMVTTPQKLAGIQSFSVPTGEGQVVFRDLPYLREDPLGVTEDWLQKAAPGIDASLHHTPETVTTSTWSLTDFAVDAPKEAPLTAHQPFTELSGQNPALWSAVNVNGLDDMLAPTADNAAAPEEDWVLPFFDHTPKQTTQQTVKPAAQPVPQAEPVPSPEPTPAIQPVVTTEFTLPAMAAQSVRVEPRVVEPAKPTLQPMMQEAEHQGIAAPKHPEIEPSTPAVTLMSIAQKLQRLRQNQATRVRPPVQEPVFTHQVEQATETAVAVAIPTPPAAPQTTAPRQRPQAPTLTEVIDPTQMTPSLRPLSQVVTPMTARGQTIVAPSSVADSVDSVGTVDAFDRSITASSPAPADAPAPTPVSASPNPLVAEQASPAAPAPKLLKPLKPLTSSPHVQGFRLDQLTAREPKLTEPTALTPSASTGRMKPLRRPDLSARPIAQMGLQPRSLGPGHGPHGMMGNSSRTIVRETSGLAVQAVNNVTAVNLAHHTAAPQVETVASRSPAPVRTNTTDKVQGFRLSDISPQRRDDR